MDKSELEAILDNHKKWLNGEYGGIRADLRGADLFGADLCGADLRGADLCNADLCGVDLCGANLRGADLCGADLCGADLRGADLCGADLCGANLRGADLRGADLCGANLDYSCLPLWCGGSYFKADIKLIYQILAHVATIECDNPETAEIRAAIMPYALKSHHAKDLGLKE